MRKILYISGTRADYGPARNCLKAIDADPELELGVAVVGMHLNPICGETWREIERDGLCIVDKISGHLSEDTLASMSASVGLYLYGISQTIARYKPDLVLVLGDRGEVLAGAIAAAFQNIAVVHLCGGSLSGSIDESIRHAITKFAHYHFVSTKEHAKRVVQMGEEKSNVHVVGLPGGNLREDAVFSKKEICEVYGLKESEPYLLLIQHPDTRTREKVSIQIEETLEALVEFNRPVLMLTPNDDAGGGEIKKKMEEYARLHANLQVLPTPGNREIMASIMANAGVLVGNSSSGVVEAMSVQLPVVNIGKRQEGREKDSFMISADYKRDEIVLALNKALFDEKYRAELRQFKSRWVKFDTSKKVAELLSNIDLTMAERGKKFININF